MHADIEVSPINAPPAALRRQKPTPAARAWSVYVLLVDDDEADRSLILSALRSDARVRNVQSSDAPDEILFSLAAGRLRPDLILLDIHMPRLTGFKFLEALRGIPAMRSTPVVFLTTSRLARDVEQARESTVNLYIVKPDSFSELKTRLGTLLEQAICGAWSRKT